MPLVIPYTFGGQAGPIPLSELDADFAAIAAFINSFQSPAFVSVVGGTGNAITLSPSPSIASYAQGQTFIFNSAAPNTGPTTVNVSGLGNKSLIYPDGTSLTGGEMLTGAPYQIEYNGSAFDLMNNAQGSGVVSWTPGLAFGGLSTGITYSQQTGSVSKIGRFVYVSFIIILTNKGSATGAASVTGLPYTINSGWQGDNAGPIASYFLTFASGYNVFGFFTGTTTLSLLNVATAASITAITNTAFANNTVIAGSTFYPA